MNQTVAVGLSGGVDSAITAYLLQKQGYAVVGLTMLTWDASLPIADEGRSGCFGPGEARDLQAAQEVCRSLGIEHHAVSLAKEFSSCVLDYFREEYRGGRTPNPCVRCNQSMKFGLLWDKAKEQGLHFDLFATGHYARLERREDRIVLRRALDRRKDQSYFLSRLSQEQLGRLLLPLGDMEKSEVKALAAKSGFKNLADKPESQDFIEAKNYDVLFNAQDAKPGPIVDLSGRQVGKHKGIVHYTVGQRKGVGLSGKGRPLYVARIDATANTVIVGPKECLYSQRFTVGGLNWIALAKAPNQSLRVQVQVRQQHKPAAATISASEDGKTISALCDEPQLAVTPGQTAVFYQDDSVAGSGTILGSGLDF